MIFRFGTPTERHRGARRPVRRYAALARFRAFVARAFPLSVVLLLAEGCGEQGPIPLVWLGKQGEEAPASTAGSIFWIEAEVNGKATASVIVDTGAPLTILNPEAFASEVPEGDARLATLSVGGITLWKVPVVGYRETLSYSPTGKKWGGVVGFTAFGQFSTSFNYRDQSVTLGQGAVPDQVGETVSDSFRLEGGGRARTDEGAVVDFPASRVLVPATIEGERYTLLVDTGASWVGLDSALFAKLTSDGRTTFMDEARLESGTSSAAVTRLRSVSALGVEIERPVAASGSGIDTLLSTISGEVGHTVDGMLGAPFLRHFYVVMDYPNQKLELRRYSDDSHIHDEYQRVGIQLRATVGPKGYSYFVDEVFPNTDAAAQQVAVGEPLLSIGDKHLDDLDPTQVDRMLLGTPRTTKMLEFAERTLGVRVDDLLPLP